MSADTQDSQPRLKAAWPVLVLALPAFVAVWSGWVGLGGLTGFGEIHPLPGIWDGLVIDTAITLPVGVETYAAYAMTVWMAGGHSDRTREFARWSTIGSLILGACGQVAYHLMRAAHVTTAPWWITTVVSCLPVAVLGMGAALAHLVHADTLTARTMRQEQDRTDTAVEVERARADAAEVEAHRRAMAEREQAHRHRMEEAAQAAALAAESDRTATARRTRTGGARKRTQPAPGIPAQGAHASSDLQRRKDVGEAFKRSVRDGAPWGNHRLACALNGCTDACDGETHRPSPQHLRAASAAASRWRRETADGSEAVAE